MIQIKAKTAGIAKSPGAGWGNQGAPVVCTNILRVVGGFVWLLALSSAAVAQGRDAAYDTARANQPFSQGSETCLTCHNDHPVDFILQTPHGMKGDKRTPFGQAGCESCHGASGDHAKSRMVGDKLILPPVLFVKPHIDVGVSASPPAVIIQTCLGCHESGLRMNWQGSKHQLADVACTSCHNPHATRDPVLVKQTQPPVCFNCHQEQRQASFQFSHHPIREGKVVCSDCHNPHGSANDKSLKEFTVNETCYLCHAEKRGPLLFEHEPVRESCLNCHKPHGSTQARLLIERPPYLCQDCHNMGAHQAIPLSGAVLPGGNASVGNGTLGAGNPLITNPRLLANGCMNCHSNIHGSNSPGGQYFTR